MDPLTRTLIEYEVRRILSYETLNPKPYTLYPIPYTLEPLSPER